MFARRDEFQERRRRVAVRRAEEGQFLGDDDREDGFLDSPRAIQAATAWTSWRMSSVATHSALPPAHAVNISWMLPLNVRDANCSVRSAAGRDRAAPLA